ncbi:MAG: NIPSNAP family protein [Spirosomaceae bacterium]|nr:NIPSNAP family protein [Spirosomataceae bacterium]
MQKFILSVLLMMATVAVATAQDTRLYEMRIYYTEPGRLDALLARFRNHTTKLFEKHGMTNVGYWVPMHEENKLVYVMSYPDRAARDTSWRHFSRDPEWNQVRKASEESGKIVAKVESIYMKATDFSPKIKSKKSKQERVFELRTYTTHAGKLPDLLARFRNHTVKLFKKHGMTNVAYWTVEGKDDMLIYILSHASEDAGKKSFDTFRLDPDWVKVRDDSERNGKINAKVESSYMKATDFSTIK